MSELNNNPFLAQTYYWIHYVTYGSAQSLPTGATTLDWKFKSDFMEVFEKSESIAELEKFVLNFESTYLISVELSANLYLENWDKIETGTEYKDQKLIDPVYPIHHHKQTPNLLPVISPSSSPSSSESSDAACSSTPSSTLQSPSTSTSTLPSLSRTFLMSSTVTQVSVVKVFDSKAKPFLLRFLYSNGQSNHVIAKKGKNIFFI